jgi:uncharacterized OB-fold protein
MTEMPLPTITPLNEPHWDGLAAGELRFQRCGACQNAWLPPREECPRCLSDDVSWEASGGRARLISWVVYRQAVHASWADRVPYNVAVVELEEGPRMITNILAAEDELSIEQPLTLRIEQESGVSVARFAPAGT